MTLVIPDYCSVLFTVLLISPPTPLAAASIANKRRLYGTAIAKGVLCEFYSFTSRSRSQLRVPAQVSGAFIFSLFLGPRR